MPRKEIITHRSVDEPTLPHSVGTKFGNLVFVAGQTPVDPNTGRVELDFREQTRTALESIKLVLEEIGTSMDNVLVANCFLADRQHFAAFNEEYSKYFPSNRPVRTTIQALLMPENLLVEVRVTA